MRDILYVRDVAELLGTSEANVFQLVYRGKLPARRLGRRIIFLRTELEEYLKSLPRVRELDKGGEGR
ncbi:MAG: helix-turn-helix domain-containing protein [Aquificota bacterium]|nr:helix-turn-helix domain-containing protein [Aquificota bacterium]MDQ7082688.1 helix-turn-helix domain-containing protein [Aquificota bacterium]